MKKDPDEPKCTYKYSDDTTCNRPLTRGYKDKEGEQYCIFHTRNDEKMQELKKQMGIEISNATESFKKDIKAQNLSEDNENHKNKIAELRSKYALNYEGASIPDGFDLFNNFVLEVDISFEKAIFKGQSDFSNVTFKGKSSFRSTTFIEEANFLKSNFEKEVNFSFANLKGELYINDTNFNNESKFDFATFNNETHFDKSKFSTMVSFLGATFNYDVHFTDAIFKEITWFNRVTFKMEVSFSGVVFENFTNFYEAIFMGNAFFTGTEFREYTWLSGMTFRKEVNFERANIVGEVIIWQSSFCEEAHFNQVVILNKLEIKNTLFNTVSFNSLNLEKGKIRFINTVFLNSSNFQDNPDTSNIRFINCTFYGISFLRSRIAEILFSNCLFHLTKELLDKIMQTNQKYLKNAMAEKDKLGEYRIKIRINLLTYKKGTIGKPTFFKRRIEKKNLLLEHKMFIERKRSKKEWEEIDFGEVRDNYMQLKVNMDRMKDYDLANDFYCGEMEMKRLGEKWFKPKRWFLALYKFLSGYGNNPGRAIRVFFLLMLLFSFPLFFDWIQIRKDINYGSIIPQSEIKIENDSFYSILMKPLFILSPDLKKNYEKNTPQNVSNNDDVMQRNCWDLLSIFFFNITAISNIYKPTYIASNEWASYYLGFVHYFIRPVQIALIILAIRRKVKRGEE